MPYLPIFVFFRPKLIPALASLPIIPAKRFCMYEWMDE
jgi:hypothetical protein